MKAKPRLPLFLSTTFAVGMGAISATAQPTIELQPIGTVATSPVAEGSAEIVAHDPLMQRLFVVNAPEARVDIISIANPKNPSITGSLDVAKFGGVANSVAVKDGVIAVAVESSVKTDAGKVVFFNQNLKVLSSVTVGSLPDMLTFTPDGRFVLVANEGEPSDDYSIDPEGSISIIDVSGNLRELTQANVRTADFRGFTPENLPKGVRFTGPEGTTVAQDMEPEYIAASANSKRAWVSLQENNALAIIDIEAAQVKRIAPLGTKNHNLDGNGLDASNEDGEIRIRKWPVRGFYMPDGIASYRVGGKDYVVCANEGDTREWGDYVDEVRIADATLSPKAFPNAEFLQNEKNLGRLKISSVDGLNSKGQHVKLFSFGARSFSIRNATGALVWDSANLFEKITARDFPEFFNTGHDENVFDDRSDDKGPEPENLAIGQVDGKFYAFVILERIGGIMTFDITNPTAPKFVQYVNNRDFTAPDLSPEAGDLGPEGVIFVTAENSPNGKPLVITACEISGTTTLFEVNSTN